MSSTTEFNHPSDCEVLSAMRERSRRRAEAFSMDPVVQERAKQISLLLIDVDGVLTDGQITYNDQGAEEKSFHVRDGMGIRLVRNIGVEVGLVTARTSAMVARRATELGIEHLFQGVGRKVDTFKEIIAATGKTPHEVAYMGDDWIDLGVLQRVGLAACPADAASEVRETCHLVTAQKGGMGAVRELCEIIVRAKGKYHSLLDQYRC